MKMISVKLEVPAEWNIIFGHAHFIKTVEDLYEILVTGASNLKFGLAFSEASQERLVRRAGNDPDAEQVAVDNLLKIGAGHSFLIVLREGFPINVLNAIKNCAEVCRIYCATANPVEVVLVESGEGGGRAVLGVIDGHSPVGVETDENIAQRREFLRAIGYKF